MDKDIEYIKQDVIGNDYGMNIVKERVESKHDVEQNYYYSDYEDDFQIKKNDFFEAEKTPKDKNDENINDIKIELPECVDKTQDLLPICKVISNISNKNISMCELVIDKTVDIGTLLLDDEYTPVTRVVEVFGPVDRPKLIVSGLFVTGSILYSVPSECSFQDPESIQLMYMPTDGDSDSVSD